MYIWERKGWPNFTWHNSTVARLLSRASKEQGRLLGKMEGLGFEHRGEAHLHILTEDVVKTSEIEGENRLLDWHAALFPTGRSGMLKIIVGQWRNDRLNSQP